MPRRKLTRAVVLLGLAASLSGAPARAQGGPQIDPLTADAAALLAVVTLPDGLRLRPDQAILDVATTQGEVRLAERFLMRLSAGADDRRTYLSLAPKDVERFRDWQRRTRDLKRAGPATGQMSLGLGACTTGAGPDWTAKGALGLRLTTGAPVATIIDSAPLVALLGPKNLAAVGPCP